MSTCNTLLLDGVSAYKNTSGRQHEMLLFSQPFSIDNTCILRDLNSKALNDGIFFLSTHQLSF